MENILKFSFKFEILKKFYCKQVNSLRASLSHYKLSSKLVKPFALQKVVIKYDRDVRLISNIDHKNLRKLYYHNDKIFKNLFTLSRVTEEQTNDTSFLYVYFFKKKKKWELFDNFLKKGKISKNGEILNKFPKKVNFIERKRKFSEK